MNQENSKPMYVTSANRGERRRTRSPLVLISYFIGWVGSRGLNQLQLEFFYMVFRYLDNFPSVPLYFRLENLKKLLRIPV